MRDSVLNTKLEGCSLDSTGILAPGKTSVAVFILYCCILELYLSFYIAYHSTMYYIYYTHYIILHTYYTLLYYTSIVLLDYSILILYIILLYYIFTISYYTVLFVL